MADARQFAKLDLGYFDNPKVADLVDLSPRAVFLHLRAILYSRQHLTDGRFPTRVVARHVGASVCDTQCQGHCPEQCDFGAAVDAGLITPLNERTAEVHDYLKHQDSAEQIERRVSAGKDAAARRWGGNSNGSGNGNGNGSPTAGANGRPNAERGEERRGDLTLIDASGAADAEPRFAEWWDAYGKKTGRAKTERKYLSIVKAKKATPDQLISATHAYITSLKAEGKHPQFLKDPLTWLNGEHWEDELSTTSTTKAQGWWN